MLYVEQFGRPTTIYRSRLRSIFVLQVFQYYEVGKDIDKRWFIAGLLVPLILLSYVPDLKTLAVCSQIANVLMGCTIGITVYYIFTGQSLNSPMDLPPVAPTHDLPEYFSLVIFAMECIGVVSFNFQAVD